MGNPPPPASGSAGPGSPTASGADPATSTGATSSGALRLAGSTSLLALVGLVAGLML